MRNNFINQKKYDKEIFMNDYIYFLDRKSNRKKVGFDSRVFTRFLKSKNRFNQKYDETYIYVININQDYFLEHNEKFTEDEILEFKNIENHFNNYPEVRY